MSDIATNTLTQHEIILYLKNTIANILDINVFEDAIITADNIFPYGSQLSIEDFISRVDMYQLQRTYVNLIILDIDNRIDNIDKLSHTIDIKHISKYAKLLDKIVILIEKLVELYSQYEIIQRMFILKCADECVFRYGMYIKTFPYPVSLMETAVKLIQYYIDYNTELIA